MPNLFRNVLRIRSLLSNFRVLLLCVGLPCIAQTRLYLPSSGSCAVDPPDTLQATWDENDNPACRPTSTTKASTALTSKTDSKAATANFRQLSVQFVSKPLSGNQTITGTVKGTIRVAESAVNDNIDKVSMKLIVVSNDGQTLRGTLLGLGDYGPTNEWATSLTDRRIADGDTVTSVNALDTDRIVIEIGFNNTTSGTTISGDMNYGDNQASDCGDDETGTGACNPFLEFSQTLTFGAETAGPPLGTLVLLGAGK